VVEDINQNVTRAASLAHENAQAADRSNEASQELGQLAGRSFQINKTAGSTRANK
jgi:methyl-accepting chemotaxis protein